MSCLIDGREIRASGVAVGYQLMLDANTFWAGQILREFHNQIETRGVRWLAELLATQPPRCDNCPMPATNLNDDANLCAECLSAFCSEAI